MGKGRETSAAAAAMGKGVGRETSVCLRVVMDGVQCPAPLLWYVVNLGDSLDLQPCSKEIEGGGEEGAEWKALNEPPMQIPPLDVFAFPLDDAADGIIVASGHKDGLFLYNVFEDSWNVLDEKFSFDGPSFTKPVIVRRSIYWVGSDESMCSYDLDTKELCRGDINFLPLKDALDTVRVLRMSYRLPFLHLHGDIFCLIWLDANHDRSHPRSVFVFHKMHVSRRFGKKEGEHSLRIKPVCTDYFLTYHGLITHFDGLVL
ncbi:hypothetical protein RHGRI_012321 [Rhododendron griersonianum]|uniref:Uncharacterized protein n=1 Tax=Rhododendron griersonianum TaxID=479676 RepID=A0AAV6KPY1_9ERIC|nr:hypothetical protein RHGRI_012321 [Rhododendron griersonianum]